MSKDQNQIDEENRFSGADQPIDVPRLLDQVRHLKREGIEVNEYGVEVPTREVYEEGGEVNGEVTNTAKESVVSPANKVFVTTESAEDLPIDVPRQPVTHNKNEEATVEHDTTEHGVVSPANEVFEYETENEGGPNQVI
jgi:hypothetical protein